MSSKISLSISFVDWQLIWPKIRHFIHQIISYQGLDWSSFDRKLSLWKKDFIQSIGWILYHLLSSQTCSLLILSKQYGHIFLFESLLEKLFRELFSPFSANFCILRFTFLFYATSSLNWEDNLKFSIHH